MSKRELYKKIFTDREAINSNKHYTRITRPAMVRIAKERGIYE